MRGGNDVALSLEPLGPLKPHSARQSAGKGIRATRQMEHRSRYEEIERIKKDERNVLIE